MKTRKEKLLPAFQYGAWVNAVSLNKLIGWRFSSCLAEMRKEGYVFKKRRGSNGYDDWKLIYKPKRLTSSK